jgi:hypothetical protein
MNILLGRNLQASDFEFARWTKCWAETLLVLCATMPLLSCYPDPRPALKGRIAGDWEEVHGTKEVLHFSENGSLVMESPREHHQCTYDFPDTKHISLNCAPPGTPASPEVWRMSFTDDDKLLIGNATETGTYKRQ